MHVVCHSACLRTGDSELTSRKHTLRMKNLDELIIQSNHTSSQNLNIIEQITLVVWRS